jgi:hypothetical protein
MCTPTQLEVGTELPPLTKAPDRAQLVKFAAGSGDFNPLHYDADFPQAYNSVTTSSTVGSRTRRWDRWCRIGSAMVGSCAESRLRTGAWIASAMPLPVMGASSAFASTAPRGSWIWSSGQRTPTVNTRPWGPPRSSSRDDRVACGDRSAQSPRLVS